MTDEPPFDKSSGDLKSLVDFLKSHQLKSDMAARMHMAEQYGIENYTGTERQNTDLLNILKAATGAHVEPEPDTHAHVFLKTTTSGELYAIWKAVKARLGMG